MIYHKRVTTKTSNATLTLAEMGDIIVDSTTFITITIPSATGHKGLWYTIINVGNGECDIPTVTTLSIEEAVYIVSDGTTWHKIVTRNIDIY